MARLLSRDVRFYVVQSGDTLSQIGERLGIAWRDIARWNQLRNPNLIYIGQMLVLEQL